jgi:hypothetical protein
MISAVGGINKLMSRLGLERNLHDISIKEIVLSPAQEVDTPRALFDEKELDRVSGTAAEDTIQGEIRKAYGDRVTHMPTTAHVVENITLVDGVLYKLGFSLEAADVPRPWLTHARNCEDREEGVLASTVYGSRYFGHWLLDDLPLGLAAADLGSPVVPRYAPSAHQKEYSRLSDIRPEKVDAVHFDRLTIIKDAGQNDFKRARLKEIRRRVKGIRPAQSEGGVFLMRGNSGRIGRRLANEQELAHFLEKQGLRAITPTELSVSEIRDICNDAPFIIGVEGSHMTHGMLAMADHGHVLGIIPPFRFTMVLKDWSDCMGLNYGFCVGTMDGAEFKADLTSVGRLLDRMHAARASTGR